MKIGCRVGAQSDLTKWRLLSRNGRQTWHYISDNSPDDKIDFHLPSDQSFFEKYALGLLQSEPTISDVENFSVTDSINLAVSFYSKLQAKDGHWPGDYGGPLFLLPGLIIVMKVCDINLACYERAEIIRYLHNTQLADGGWGLHTADKSTLFGTVLNYVSLRLLGVSKTESNVSKALNLIHKFGGAVAIPSWGKFWLSVLNVYSWDGMNSILPELWIMPTWLPVHPSKMWCHCRQVYLGMGYCYANKLSGDNNDPIIQELRSELYLQPYEDIFWPAHRNNVSLLDTYTPHSLLLDTVLIVLNKYEYVYNKQLRQHSVNEIIQQVVHDDTATHYISIGPISKVIQTLISWHMDGPNSAHFENHKSRLRDYLWLGADGMKMQGTNGSQLWDTAFAVQALYEAKESIQSDVKENFITCLRSAFEWILNTQILENPSNYKSFYRQANKGAFPFSTRECGWIVSDCTGEGLRILCCIADLLNITVESRRIYDCVDRLLEMQNTDGGYASYEKQRGGTFIELLNPSEIFGDIMIDYSYTECTSSVIQALVTFKNKYSDYKSHQIHAALRTAETYIRRQQKQDGSWEGSWGVCFTYGVWFAIEALVILGYTYSSKDKAVMMGCDFLLSKQNMNGGWGEDFTSCTKRTYVQHKESQIVNTSWALLALLNAEYPDYTPIKRAVKFIQSKQLVNGDWPEEDIKGVFNKTCAIAYTSYKNVFPIWALSVYNNKIKQLNENNIDWLSN